MQLTQQDVTGVFVLQGQGHGEVPENQAPAKKSVFHIRKVLTHFPQAEAPPLTSHCPSRAWRVCDSKEAAGTKLTA